MKEDVQQGLFNRLLSLVEGQTTDLAESVWERPAQAYADPGRFALEVDIMFRRTPVLACFSCDLPEPGDYVTHEHTGVPIFILRKDSGAVVAFANICRHRGARLLDGERGRLPRARITCPYHGWTYDAAGALVGLPHRSGFTGLDCSDRSLIEIPCVEAQGLIFVCTDPEAKIDLRDHLGQLQPDLAGWEFERLHPVTSRVIEPKINWKLALDTFGEGYHFSVLHKATINQLTHSNVMTYDRLDRHYRLAFPSRAIEEAAKDGAGQHPMEYMSLVYYLYPNISLNVSGARELTVRTFRIWPVAPNRCSVVHSLYTYGKPSRSSQEDLLTHFNLMHDVVADEDFGVAEGIQRNIEAGIQDAVVFGRNEPSLIDVEREFDRVVSAG